MAEAWRTSSRSGGNSCVEVSLPQWRKSSRSTKVNCVEVAIEPGAVLVRHSKLPTGRVLRFSRHEWDCFVQGVKAGEFDL